MWKEIWRITYRIIVIFAGYYLYGGWGILGAFAILFLLDIIERLDNMNNRINNIEERIRKVDEFSRALKAGRLKVEIEED